MNLRHVVSVFVACCIGFAGSGTSWAASRWPMPSVAGNHAAVQTVAAQTEGWLNGGSIARAINGNTSEANFLEGNNVQLLYWSPDHKVIAKARNQSPKYVGDWHISGNRFCIRSRGGDFCYYMRNAGNYLEGWAIKPQGTNRSMLLTMYRGDAFELVKQRQEFQQGRSWTSVANMLGLAIVGTALAAVLSGGYTGNGSSGNGDAIPEAQERASHQRPEQPNEGSGWPGGVTPNPGWGQ